ncbi:MAG TPA: hypothetical protein VIN08_06535, partial [Ohtaekwangia sp.]|uniref:hypothetical protein n=1 Tax=Ohtaekwangia sp. TaxID=2066019 RepID=UPI002F946DF8
MPNSRNSNNNSGRSRGRSNASRPTGKLSRNSRDASAKGSGKFDRKDSPKSFRKKSDDGFEAKRPSAFSKPGKKYFNSNKSNSSEGGERKGFGKSSDR